MTIPAKQVFFCKFLKWVKQIAVEYYLINNNKNRNELLINRSWKGNYAK